MQSQTYNAAFIYVCSELPSTRRPAFLAGAGGQNITLPSERLLLKCQGGLHGAFRPYSGEKHPV
jgi:hypothetical protein